MELRSLAARVAEVCADSLGFSPAIEGGSTDGPERCLPLDYRVDKLARAGFTSTASLDSELKTLLVMARSAFGSS
jgi:hypothetical protein